MRRHTAGLKPNVSWAEIAKAKALAYLEANVSSNYSGTTIQDLSGLNSVVAVAVSVVVLPRSFW
jgi:hypothetical protein